jgi:hypothetical protein
LARNKSKDQLLLPIFAQQIHGQLPVSSLDLFNYDNFLNFRHLQHLAFRQANTSATGPQLATKTSDTRAEVQTTLPSQTLPPRHASEEYGEDDDDGNSDENEDDEPGNELEKDDDERKGPVEVDDEGLAPVLDNAEDTMTTSHPAVNASTQTKSYDRPATGGKAPPEHNSRPTSRKKPAEGNENPAEDREEQEADSEESSHPTTGGKTINKCDFPWTLPELNDHLTCLFQKLEKEAMPLVRAILGAHLDGVEYNPSQDTQGQNATSEVQNSEEQTPPVQNRRVQEQVDIIFRTIKEHALPVTQAILEDRLPWLIEAALAKLKDLKGGKRQSTCIREGTTLTMIRGR